MSIDNLLVADILPEREITFFLKNSTVSQVLETLSEKGITSAPVVDAEAKRFYGFVDMLDIVTFLLAEFPAIESEAAINAEYLQALEVAAEKFWNHPIEEVLSMSQRYHQDESRFVTVHLTSSLRVLLQHFYSGLHRVAVVDHQNNVINIVTQSDVLAFMARNVHLLSLKEEKTITELGIGTEGVFTVPHDMRVVKLLQKLVLLKLSAVPVIDGHGKIVANFSVSNLKGLRKRQFPDLLLPVLEFLTKQVVEDAPYITKLPSHLKEKSLLPLICRADSTLEYCLFKLVATRTHRLWCVDGDGHPLKVVSLTDVMKGFL